MRRFWVGASGAKKLCALGAIGRFCAAPSTSPLACRAAPCYILAHEEHLRS